MRSRGEKRIAKELINSSLFQIVLGDDDRALSLPLLYPLAFMQLSKTLCRRGKGGYRHRTGAFDDRACGMRAALSPPVAPRA